MILSELKKKLSYQLVEQPIACANETVKQAPVFADTLYVDQGGQKQPAGLNTGR